MPLLERGPKMQIFTFDSIDSTSTECRRIWDRMRESFAVTASSQSAGRGRSGKSFYSPEGGGLYLSVALKGHMNTPDCVGITTYAGVCAVRALEEIAGVHCRIKWVNDIFHDGLKVGGILTEALPGGIIVGIGLNLSRCTVPPELEGIMGCLDCAEYKAELTGALINGISSYVPGSCAHMDSYREYSLVLGKEVRFINNGLETTGTALSISDDGSLNVDTGSEILSLFSGEVSIRPV